MKDDPLYVGWYRFGAGPWREASTADRQRVQGYDREYIEFWLRGCHWPRADVETLVLEDGERPTLTPTEKRKGDS